MLLKIFSTALLCGIANSQGFSYQDPTTWGLQYPTCNGNNQSPVDIPWGFGDSVIVQPGELQWNNYGNIPDSMRIVNNGHTVQINPTWLNASDRPYLIGGPLQGQYILEQFHFHWGQNDSVGSEHTFNGQRTAMELHMVHWKSDYGAFEAAASQADGLAVIGALYDPISAKSSNGIEQTWRQLENLRQTNAATRVEPFPLSDFEVVNSKDTYVSYYGSLTTPGCNEVVTWLVALDLFSITNDELQQIRSVGLSHGDDHNYRPVQNLNDRSFAYYRSN
ncbi:carbonic anhydrase 1 [Diachasma alloeum]|uniref:carbonic anhydrase 1 n=1 Tax=Diachasma alloeum TaxID=454923 RepID=UPI0007382BC9|nr:carbonic anhydrase 1 [Diachasma alloeum]